MLVYTSTLVSMNGEHLQTPVEHKFSCPACDQHITAPMELLGTEITCPHCQSPFVLPMPLSSPLLLTAKQKARVVISGIAALGLLAVAAGVALFALALMNDTPSRPNAPSAPIIEQATQPRLQSDTKKDHTLVAWRALQAANLEMSKLPLNGRFKTGIALYAEIPLDDVDPALISYLEAAINTYREADDTLTRLHAEMSSIDNATDTGDRIVGDLSTTADTEQQGAAFNVFGKWVLAAGKEAEYSRLHKKYETELNERDASLNAVEHSKVELANQLSQKYAVPFLVGL
jgi:hypothetical protein